MPFNEPQNAAYKRLVTVNAQAAWQKLTKTVFSP